MAEYNLFTCSKSTLGQFSVVGVSRDCDMAVVIGHLVLILLLSVLLPVEAKPPKCNKSKNFHCVFSILTSSMQSLWEILMRRVASSLPAQRRERRWNSYFHANLR